ncbi:MAG: UDP-glucose/GDP-mannose dehydrogenase family protein [Actinobacteria bacterium]|nr:UDP-glucose/GDP-mannose dehydrogenase family protein [Actinomycetota bacterium]
MKLSVIGVGYLGAVHAASMASLGFEVVGVDVDLAKLDALRAGKAPFYEPGFDELLAEVMPTGRLTWTDDYAAIADADVHFVCVGTPQRRGSHSADLRYVWAAVESMIPHLRPDSVVAGKSTVPVGTAAAIAERLGQSDGPVVVWNPEFLREGFAVADTLHPDRIVVGVPEGPDGLRAEQVMREVYAAQIAEGIPFLVTDRPTAELVKVAANAFLATKISFINAMAEVCEATGADVVTLADAIGHDARIGRKFLGAGVGFGGGCLPKDIRAFSARAGELGVDQALTFLRQVDDINSRRRDRAVETARELVGGSFRGRRVCVLGAAFKPDSDDVRDSPALDIAARIHNEGGEVVVHDPKALVNAESRFPALTYEPELAAALAGAEVVLVLTEWRDYRELDPLAVADVVAAPRILDGRNVLDAAAWQAAGWSFRGMGRAHG